MTAATGESGGDRSRSGSEAAREAVSFEAFRREFPMLERFTHLANCSLGARSSAVEAALRRMLDVMAARGAPWDEFEGQTDEARRRFAALIGASPGQIAIVPNASVGAYQVASTLEYAGRDRILATVEEFPSVAHVWLAQRPRGARVTLVGAGDGAVRTEDYLAALDRRTALLSVPLSTYQYAERPAVAELVCAAREAGARSFVDAYQAAGVLPVDVAELGCDYLVAGTSKYLLGLPGLAFLYVREGAAGDLDPALTGWFGRREPFAFDPRRLDFPDGARRFETGTAAVPSLYAANAALELVGRLDLAEVERHIAGLRRQAAEALVSGGEVLRTADRPGAHLALLDPDPPALAGWLAGRDIAVSPRGPVVRLAFHYYNSPGDVAALCGAVQAYRDAGGRTAP